MFLFYVILSPPNEKHTNNSNIINNLNDNKVLTTGLNCKTQSTYQACANNLFTVQMRIVENMYHHVS